MIELFTQQHYRESIEPDADLSPLFKDIFLFHWKEESQHAILDELEWRRHDESLTPAARDKAVDEFIELAIAIDALLRDQSSSDAEYFGMTCGRSLGTEAFEAVKVGLFKAYRYQYILSGAQHPHFLKVLGGLIDDDQSKRIEAAVASLQ